MADGFGFSLENDTVAARLAEIAGRLDKMAPVMAAIGETLAESTKRRFDTSTAPDGARWAPNSEATMMGHLGKISGEFADYSNLKTRKEGQVRVGDKKGYFRKDGRLASKASTAMMNKKPLVDSGLLQDSFVWQLADGGNAVEVGTNRFAGEWDGGAAVFHYGRRDGSIPAREILGISAADEIEVLDILDHFAQQAIG